MLLISSSETKVGGGRQERRGNQIKPWRPHEMMESNCWNRVGDCLQLSRYVESY